MAGSLASATSTRVDSASKHIVPCKVNTDYMASLVGENTENSMRELQTNKMRYCMHKDDVVIGLGRPMYGSSVNNNRKKAYPSVIVTLASMELECRRWIAIHNFMVTNYSESGKMKDAYLSILESSGMNFPGGVIPGATADVQTAIQNFTSMGPDKRSRIKNQIENLLEFYFVGISLGLAYAHPHSGDTVASVMIGGLRTILNGHFQVHTNDLLMVYWGDDEVDLFEENGGRKDRSIMQNPDGTLSLANVTAWTAKDEIQDKKPGTSQSITDRRNYYGRGNGVFKNGPDGSHKGKCNIAMVKPYIVSMHSDPSTNAAQHFPMDKARIFGKAISNAQPFEMLDVMLSRQAI